MHLNVSDPVAWYAEMYPDFRVYDVVPGPCLSCFSQLSVGDRVVTRRVCNENNPIEAGQVGHITKIWQNNEFGNMFVVTLQSGKDLLCPRSALKKHNENNEEVGAND